MKKSLKIVLLLLSLAIIAGLFFYFRLSDIRPEGYTYPNNIVKAQQLFDDMGKAHQIDQWDSIGTYNVVFEDDFHGFLGKMSHSFATQKNEFSFNYIPNTYDGQIKMLNGKDKGKTWGIQSGKTYYLDKTGRPIAEENKNMQFWLPTYQYFIELPSRIQEATVIDYLGTKTINGVEADGVIASWNTVAPQRNIDQYIVWMDASSKRIVQVAYTVRDKYAFVTGAANYQDYQDYAGIILPKVMPVESNLLREGYLHKMSIKSFTANKVAVDALVPLD